MTIDEALNYSDECEFAKYAGSGPTAQLAAEVRRLREENDELQSIFDMQHGRVGRLTIMWCEAKNKPDVRPDLGELAGWAAHEIDRLRERERMLVNLLDQWDESAVLTGATGSLVEFTRAALEAVKE